MATWSTINIFELNETQIIGTTDNGFVSNSIISVTLANFYSAISAITPVGSIITLNDTRVLTIYDSISIVFSPNSFTPGNQGCTISWTSVDPATLSAIIALAADIAINI
jgi:hypothetical protein